ncbi:MAG: hypothetical protein BRD30_02225 [Bacteroidetes bacterium QH_2_63_10]|nr:MAG: hypothetical protein BRD30_02225 [Bacteroidetes bacterium QH_2_63_10]
MRMSSVGLVLAMVLGVFLAGACSGPSTLQTQSLSRAPTIDGVLSDWGGTLTRVEDGSVSMSAVPTDSTLYLALLIRDQGLIRSVAEQGLVVWVDPSGKEQHTYGVRYPLGLRAQRAEREGSPSASDASQRSLVLDDLFPSDLAVIRNDTVRRRMPAGFVSGLEAQATLDTGSLIYEIAIPVAPSGSGPGAADWQHGLRTPLGAAVAIGLETPDSDDDSGLVGRPEGVPSATGRSGRGRSPRGRRRGQRGRQGQQAPPSQPPESPSLDLWTKIVSANGQ